MFIRMLATGDILPETLHFLNLGWWIVHIIAIVALLAIGYAIGKKKGGQPTRGTAAPSKPAAGAGGAQQE